MHMHRLATKVIYRPLEPKIYLWNFSQMSCFKWRGRLSAYTTPATTMDITGRTTQKQWRLREVEKNEPKGYFVVLKASISFWGSVCSAFDCIPCTKISRQAYYDTSEICWWRVWSRTRNIMWREVVVNQISCLHVGCCNFFAATLEDLFHWSEVDRNIEQFYHRIKSSTISIGWSISQSMRVSWTLI